MKKFFKILKSIWGPLLLLAFVVYLLLGLNVIPVRVMVDEMILTANAGTIIDGFYTNYKLGIQFQTPSTDDGEWRSMTYQEQFTRQPYYVYNAAKAGFAVLEPYDKPYHDFLFSARYDAIRTSKYRNETTKELAQRLRDDYVRLIVKNNRDEEGMYNKSFDYTDIEPAVINGSTYYKYYIYDKNKDIHLMEYVIRRGDFGFIFKFNGQGEEIDPEFVMTLIHSIVYTEQDFNVSYERKSPFE